MVCLHERVWRLDSPKPTHPFNAIRIALKNKDASIQSVNGAIVNAIRPFLYENTEREPIIIPMILTPDEE